MAQRDADAQGAPAGSDDPLRELLAEIGLLAAKLALIAVALWCALTFAFGAYRVSDGSMEPVLCDCDLVLFWRPNRSPQVDELAVFSRDGRTTACRVVARAGDVVDIDAHGLTVNGAHQSESRIRDATTQVAGGVTFPLTVGEGQVFVLGDNRPEAVDSRIVGCIDEDDLLGTVIGVFRRRNF